MSDLVHHDATPAAPSPAAVYLASLRPGSRRTMRGALEVVAEIASAGRFDAERLPWHRLGSEHVAAIRAALMDRYPPGSVNKHLSALRGALRAAWRQGLMDTDRFQRAIDVPYVKHTRRPAGRALEDHELRALFSACGEDLVGRRDAAALALMVGAGLRRAEVCALLVDDYDDLDPKLGGVEVRGKGGTHELVYVSNAMKALLDAWIELRGYEAGPLICPTEGPPRRRRIVYERHLEPKVLWDVCRRRARRAGIAGFSPHDLRRTYISALWDLAPGDAATVQRLARHAKIQTTVGYDRREERAKVRTARLLEVPT